MELVDVAVVGRGAVGAAAALALAAPERRIMLIGTAPPDLPIPAAPSPWDVRVLALSPASRLLLERLGAWHRMDPARIAPVYDMRIINAASPALPEVHLDAYGGQIEALAWIVEHRELQAALGAALAGSPVETLTATVSKLDSASRAPASVTQPDDRVTLELADGSVVRARLVVAADGIESSLRDQAGLGARLIDHHQSAIVTNFESERPSRDVAWQWFSARGVVALLPLPAPLGADRARWRGRWSLVWSVPDASFEEAQSRPLAESIGAVTESRFGRLRQIGAARSFQLRSVRLRTVIAPGLVVIGDAAHAVHPMAGQGLNLGFGDVAALAATVGSCPALGARAPQGSPGDRLILRRYERSRAETVLTMQVGLSALERLFAAPPRALTPPVAVVRDFGWRWIAANAPLRRWMIRHAVS